jgi:hypothetical protein
MKKFVLMTLTAVFCLWQAGGAWAFSTPVENEKGRAILQKMGTDLGKIAAGFNCPEFAWANFIDGGRVAAFVYTPPGVDFKTAPRSVSVAIHALEGDAAKDKATLNAVAQNLQASYKQNAKINKLENFHNAKDEPGFFIDYAIGEGAAKQHNAGVFLRLTSHTAAFVQVQSRGRALTADDIAKVKSLIAAPATAKGKPAAAKKG